MFNNNQIQNQFEVSNKNEDIHIEFEYGKIINEKYIILQKQGEGTFGRCYSVKNIENGQYYVIKCIKRVERFIRNAQNECKIITQIHQYQIENKELMSFKKYIVQLIEWFFFENTIIIVFEPLGKTLQNCLEQYKLIGLKYLIKITQEILQATLYLHSIGITHTDLKPENIICTNPQSQNQMIKIIDFGGATWDFEQHNYIINTRNYRAPEVILMCQQWNNKSDIWSIGCLILQLYTGKLYFDACNDYEQLALINKYLKIPEFMLKTSKLNDFQFQLNYKSRQKVARLQPIENIIRKKRIKDYQLIQLVKQMLIVDPRQRISCQQALKNSLFDENNKQQQ